MNISKHFKRSEFQCKCCGQYRNIDIKLLNGLEILREKINKPIIINSGYRCEKHPLEINKMKTGMHTLGKAADIKIPNGITKIQLLDEILLIPDFYNGGIGLPIYSNYIHVDVRGWRSRWGYDKQGKQIDYIKALKELKVLK